MNTRQFPNFILGFAVVLVFGLTSSVQTQEPAKPKYTVKVDDDKTVVVDMEDSGAIDPMKRINFQAQGKFGNFNIGITTLQNQPLHLSHQPQFMIDGAVTQPGAGGRFEAGPPLGKTASGRQRIGSAATWVTPTNLRITQTAELVPARPKKAGDKRLMNTIMIAYNVENKSAQPHKVAMRILMDTYVVTNDGCLFAAPTMPGKILDGIVLKDKTLPPYVQMLQNPNLANPGFVSHLTLNMGSRYDKAEKVTLSSLRVGFGQWDMPVAPAMGDSAICFNWAAKEIKAGGKRDLAYAYGEGIAVAPDSEGRFQMALGGSFEPGKVFTISAVVADPMLGQTMTLELPAGMERLEGKEIQPVAPLTEGQEFSSVLWKARVLQPGQHPIRIRSSSGMTQAKIVSITAEK